MGRNIHTWCVSGEADPNSGVELPPSHAEHAVIFQMGIHTSHGGEAGSRVYLFAFFRLGDPVKRGPMPSSRADQMTRSEWRMGGLAHPLSDSSLEAAPPVAVFDGRAPRTANPVP